MIDSLSQLSRLMRSQGVTQWYAKRLSPNDNSKNQVYLGGNFSSLNIIPHGAIYTDGNRYKANLAFFWIDESGKYPAPHAQLILYPNYPEVRFSGFLMGCTNAPSTLMQGRERDRVLFLGVTPTNEVLGYVVGADSALKRELEAQPSLTSMGVFLELPVDMTLNARNTLLMTLRSIHEKQWIDSCRLNADGTRVACTALNAGGYTLEAELGITPNGMSEPDYLGWEVKSHRVKRLSNPVSGQPVTLMTPEPTGGLYKQQGVEAFMRRFGYPDTSGKEDRINFGGPYKCEVMYHRTQLTLVVEGYDVSSGTITKLDGGISLLTTEGEAAAKWHFTELMTLWNRKHAKAVYVPSLRRDEPVRQYCYGDTVQLGEGTDFYRLLHAVAAGKVYYDPAIKLENISTLKPQLKRRSQFRMKLSDLSALYHTFEKVNLNLYPGEV